MTIVSAASSPEEMLASITPGKSGCGENCGCKCFLAALVE